MATESIEVRLAVVEHEARNTSARIERELATGADIAALRGDLRTEIQASRNSMIRWMFGLMLAQPIVWLGAIAAARRLGLLG